MLRYNASSEKMDTTSVQYEKPRKFKIQQNFTQNIKEINILDETTCQYVNQNENIQNWINGCQVLGFIPDHPASNNFATQSYSLDYHNQQTFASSISSQPAQTKLRANLKRKRKRTTFTTEQIVYLEGMFQRNPYITRNERVAVMNTLQLSEKSIKVWFQNRRRMTDRKHKESASDSPSSIDTADSFSDRLNIIETQIKENTDEYGYVTLNDQIMGELVSIVDDYLSKDVSFDDSNPISNSTTPENVVLYEPISPASSDYYMI